MYVSRNTSVKSANQIDKVDKVPIVKNETSYSNPNSQIDTYSFYDHLKKNPLNKEEIIYEKKENKSNGFSESSLKNSESNFIEMVQKLVDVMNNEIIQIHKIDIAFKSNYYKKILRSYKNIPLLKDIGILINEKLLFYINKERLTFKLRQDSHLLEKIFDSNKGDLYNFYKNLKNTKETAIKEQTYHIK